MNRNERLPFFLLLALAVVSIAFVLSSATKTSQITGQQADYPVLSVPWVRLQIREVANSHHVNADMMDALAGCESGWNYRAVSPNGRDIGLFQISSDGLAPAFYARGFKSRFNTWESSVFTAEMIQRGEARQWSCYWMNLGLRPPWWH